MSFQQTWTVNNLSSCAKNQLSAASKKTDDFMQNESCEELLNSQQANWLR